MRKRVRAIIIEEDKILLMHRVVGEREYWIFPGGGVEDNDADLEAALIRECEEELGVQVEVGEFFANSYFELDGETWEQHIFRCKIIGGELGTGQGPEYQEGSGYEGSFEVEWVHKSEMKDKYILPQEVKDKIIEDII
jgi:8-oxo-dGTP pyrophosphatase MutT (NUDIX family)